MSGSTTMHLWAFRAGARARGAEVELNFWGHYARVLLRARGHITVFGE